MTTDDEGRRIAHEHLERKLAATEDMVAELRGLVNRLVQDISPRFGSLAAARVYYRIED